MLHLLFSTEGRINRFEWWLGQLIAVAVVALLSIVFHVSIPQHLTLGIFSLHNLTVGAVIGVCYFYIHCVVNIKRWHDLDKHGLWAVLNYLPLIGFFVSVIVCGMMKGKHADKENSYGSSSV